MECQKLDASLVSASLALIASSCGLFAAIRPRPKRLALLQAQLGTAAISVAIGVVWLAGNADTAVATLLAVACGVAWLGFWGSRAIVNRS